MSGENIGPRGCQYIAGDPRDIHTDGLAIFCGKPAAHPGGSWCDEHRAIVFLPADALLQPRKAA